MARTLNGSSENIAGYCKLHHCGLTVKQIKQKQCLCKACWHLQKNEEHSWWIQRAALQQKRNERKVKFAMEVQKYV